MYKQRSLLDTDITLAYAERRGQLHAVARRAGNDDAHDLVQDSFLKALEADRNAAVQKPLHFLLRVARNLAIDRLRSKGRASIVFSGAEAPDVADLGASPERALLASERLARALQIVENMPARRREVFLLHRIEELTLSQCAARLGISVKTVEKHMTEAMAQLSREIDRN